VAEYGDIVLQHYAKTRGSDPVLFSHSIHRVKFRCSVCHGELGFEMKAGANDINMAKIAAGKYCGACHNGRIASGSAQCDRCHVPKASQR
jgi:c(7)-type cytochrome triheme protein